MLSQTLPESVVAAPAPVRKIKTAENSAASAFSNPRDFLQNRFVYLTLSPRARGLSVGVNLNPDRACNFDCAYCEVDRTRAALESVLDVDAAADELAGVLEAIHNGRLQTLFPYKNLPRELLQLRHVALSGDGEPTLSPQFLEAVQAVAHVRARGSFPFFKMVLISNASGLDRPEVKMGLRLFTPRDEVWAKLDAGSQRFMDAVNRPDRPLEKIVENIVGTAQIRPVIIQSLFCQINGVVPSPLEIEQFAELLRDMKARGAQIPLVQIYSATRPTSQSNVRHLPLKSLSDIAATVRRVTGLKAESF